MTLAHRIEPLIDAGGKAVELNPPCGGSWLRDADGGLTPADAQTAANAGLSPLPAKAIKPIAVAAPLNTETE